LEIKPTQNIGVIYNKDEQASVVQLEEMQTEARKRGLTVLPASADRAGSAPAALDSLASRSDSIYLSEAYPSQQLAEKLISAARARGVPVISQIPGSAELGALVSLEADPTEQGSLLAVHTIQVLSGKKTLMLGVRTAKKVSLALNKTTAQACSLSLPPDLLDRADRVVQ
ncbi:MAG TPA: ABC transporter substrate binding protein, partial [Desulfuromonadales bacterium]|nr:ABC transporter substrate binding protein [Desulfuromonadales bacterium]